MLESRCLWPVLAAFSLAVAGPLDAADAPAFRTDANPDAALKWYQLVDGKFPPVNSAHTISGELIQCDHPERRFQIRVDRDDSQQVSHFDLPFESALLPYGAVYYHGGPAALQDIPIGTHLHGLYYLRDPGDTSPPPGGAHGRHSAAWEFKRCLRLEDDFSFRARQQQAWRIEAVDLAGKKLTATLLGADAPVGKPLIFDLTGGTRVHVGHGFGTLESIAVGQTVQLNITWATLQGPGRVLDIWLDEPSRQLATELQTQRHRDHIRDRGLPGWIEAVDDEAQIVTITFFDSVDPGLFKELTGSDEEPHGWPFSAREDDPKAPKGGIAVARECLMTYEPMHDRKGGNILAIDTVPVEVGSSGVRIKVKCCMLLDGFRPGRIVRFYPATWKVNILPREEQFFGRE
ncbi:MAG: hypothetical protein WCQ77_09825 [Planctomycetota bacterium]